MNNRCLATSSTISGSKVQCWFMEDHGGDHRNSIYVWNDSGFGGFSPVTSMGDLPQRPPEDSETVISKKVGG
jgi:hypothetical protein